MIFNCDLNIEVVLLKCTQMVLKTGFTVLKSLLYDLISSHYAVWHLRQIKIINFITLTYTISTVNR